jgi:hypothetical protein
MHCQEKGKGEQQARKLFLHKDLDFDLGAEGEVVGSWGQRSKLVGSGLRRVVRFVLAIVRSTELPDTIEGLLVPLCKTED